jgi:RES domain-containing protein
MRFWRIDRLGFTDKFSGFGAYKTPGRWHHRGNRVIYTSAAASLAALEFLAHLDPDIIPSDISLLEIEVPEDISVEKLDDPAKLNPNWRRIHLSVELQDFGTQWLLECRTVILAIPSAIIPIETNYLLNPVHPEFSRVSLINEAPFAFDPRLLKK